MIRRKRGRPRRDEPVLINDFDLTLIQEFKKRPAFYDRSHPQYRNREILDPQWIELSKIVGYNVALVKERILQLRNRYNLERRRIDTLQEQYPDENIASTWKLYEHLSFLGEHIKSRGSVGRPSSSALRPLVVPKLVPLMIKKNEFQESDTSEMETEHHIQNGNITDDETLAEQQHDEVLVINHANNINRKHITQQQNSHHRHHHHSQSIPSMNNSGNPLFEETEVIIPSQMNSLNHVHTHQDKFHSFGQFITSSLIDMSEKNALLLVEKFTTDVVQLLLSEQTKSRSHNTNNNN